MEDMYVHQYAKEEPNQFTNGVVISPDVHAHSPLTQTSFLLQIYIYLYFFTSGKGKFLGLHASPYVHLCMQYPVNIKI